MATALSSAGLGLRPAVAGAPLLGSLSGLESPDSKGLSLFRGASAFDDLAAQVYMGLACECGGGVPKDIAEAGRLFASALSQIPTSDEPATLARSIAVKRLSSIADAPSSATETEDGCNGRW
jgi:hypothetical protein